MQLVLNMQAVLVMENANVMLAMKDKGAVNVQKDFT